jgi:hypothetical protein
MSGAGDPYRTPNEQPAQPRRYRAARRTAVLVLAFLGCIILTIALTLVDLALTIGGSERQRTLAFAAAGALALVLGLMGWLAAKIGWR